MKILLVTIIGIETSSTPLFMKKGLEKLDCQVKIVSPDEHRSFIERVLIKRELQFRTQWLWAFGRRVFKEVLKFEPDILFIFGSNFYLMPYYLKKIRGRCKIIIYERNFQLWKWYQAEAIKYYDYCFVQDSFLAKLLSGPANKKNVLHLPEACDVDVHKKIDVSRKDLSEYGADVSFLGSAFPNRIKLFEGLRECNFKLWGKGWDASEILKPSAPSRFVSEKEKIIIYNASKININIQNTISQVDGLNTRFFEILGCGGFMLAEYKKDIERYFTIGEDIEVFYSSKDLNDKIKYYLEHPEERDVIAEKGHEKVKKSHTYNHRMEEMLDFILRNE